jgi:hypothetical protein
MLALPWHLATAMQNRSEPRRYSLDNYDRNFCLRPPWLLWVGALFLSRAITLPLLIGIGSLGGGSANANELVHGLFPLRALASSCIAFPVLCALALRAPSSGRAVRWLVRHGRLLLAVAAAADALLSLSTLSLERIESADDQVGVALLGVLFDVYLCLYVLVSRRVRDVFGDFPSE